MKKIIFWLAASFMTAPALLAQTPCPTVSSLDLSTGRDALTSTLIPFSNPDPNWIITGLTPDCAALPGAVSLGQEARVCNNWSLGAGTARWISFLNAGTYITNASLPVLSYGFTATRAFRVCEEDSFLFSFDFANDNFCTNITVDGIPIFPPQAPSSNTSNYMTFTPVSAVLVLGPGVHNISVTVHNYPVQNFSNPHGFILVGGVSSLASNTSLIAPDAPDKCECIRYECSDYCYWRVEGNNIIGGRNKFGTLSYDDVEIITNGKDRGIFTREGLFGWNTMAPTAYLHVNCAGNNEKESDVRFEELEKGTGNILVIDKEGYVYDSKVPLALYVEYMENIRNENRELKEELQDLKAKMDMLLNQAGNKAELKSNYLEQNYPNPFEATTTIAYNVVSYKRQANIIFVDARGAEIVNHVIHNTGKGLLTVDTGKMRSPGIYTYSLVIDGIVVDTKKMTLVR